MLLLIDNYDSFVYNLYQMLGAFSQDIEVIRNDKITIADIKRMQPDKIVLSPGPGRPEEAGEMEEIIRQFYDKIPILGVCLGHQAICQVFGSTITYANKIMHGKTSKITIYNDNTILKGIKECQVARYHSLVVQEDTLPMELEILAKSEDGEVMAVGHHQYPIYGLQFHPESILTTEGYKMLKNFCKGERA